MDANYTPKPHGPYKKQNLNLDSKGSQNHMGFEANPAQSDGHLFSYCALCNETSKLQQSHIIPAFAIRWLKKTSGTGYLRGSENPNLRLQDAKKIPLLCSVCEGKFSKDEADFAAKIFHPYVSEELSDEGVATGKIKNFAYQEWLLRFVISLHWRIITTSIYTKSVLPPKLLSLLCAFEEIWRDFLLQNRKTTGECETHLFFLQSLASARGKLPPDICDKINFYLLRATDATPLYNQNKLGIYSKLGPVAFYTSLNPLRLKNSGDTKLKKNGSIKTIQSLKSTELNQFI